MAVGNADHGIKNPEKANGNKEKNKELLGFSWKSFTDVFGNQCTRNPLRVCLPVLLPVTADYALRWRPESGALSKVLNI